MKSSTYWKERFELVERVQNQLGVQCYAQVEQQYRQAQRQIEDQINAWYGRFAANNGVTMQEARKMLTNRELCELKWDVSQYIRYGEENAVNGAWMRQLENASARYHVSRLEALKLQTQQSLEVMFGNQLDTVDTAMKDVYTNGYYHTAFEVQKGLGVAWDFATLDERAIQKVINRPWAADGKNFSERIWTNRQKLVNELNTELTRNIMLGQDPQKAIDAISRKMGASKANAGRLVMTEEAFFSSAAQKDCFNELDVEHYIIQATIDKHTSEICQEMDGKVFPMSQWEVGVTAPPFHVRCRTTTAPASGDEFDLVGQRAARGEDGKTYYIPASMTYQEWKKAMVEGDKAGFGASAQEGVDHGARKGRDGKIPLVKDITRAWTKAGGTEGAVIERQEYIVNGTTYKVDGKHVILRPTKQEREVAGVLSVKYGKSVELVPQVMVPQGVQTPDYLVDGERFDLKAPTGRGKDLFYNVVSKKRKQASSFIFDITDCPLSEDEVRKQVEALFFSRHTRFIEKIVIMRGGEILKVYGRK